MKFLRPFQKYGVTMSKFIVISKHALSEHAPSDVILNLDTVHFFMCTDGNSLGIKIFGVSEQEKHIDFNNEQTRDHYFNFMIKQCGAVDAPSILESVK